MNQNRWGPDVPDSVWKPTSGRGHQAAAQEQDKAAGSRKARTTFGPGGEKVIVSIRLQRLGRRIYAYLQAKTLATSFALYVGEARGQNRQEMLAYAWRLARRKGKLKKMEEKYRKAGPVKP